MREIKFRAWVKSGGYSEMLPNVQNHIGAATGFGHLIQGTAKGIDESHVMQFTGLTDKSGAEICEGDIVEEGGEVCVIEWLDKHACFGYKTKTTTAKLYGFYGSVIGNIYQDPELLK